MKTATLFSPRHPVKGMVSARSVFTLLPGEYALLQNVRVDDGVIKCRDGLGDLSATSLPSGYVCGAAQLVLNGTDYVFVAVDTGTAGGIQVWASTGVAFTEWTRSSVTPYLNSRFSTATNASAYSRIAFVAVKATTRTDTGILSNTSDEDLVIASDGEKSIVSSVSDAAFIQTTTPATPTKLNLFRQEATFPDFMPISTGLSGVADTANVTAATSGTYTPTGGAAPKIEFGTGIATDGTEYGELQWTTANDICQGPCVAIMYGTNEPNIWDRVKLGFYDLTNTTLKTVWNPDSTTTTKDKPTVVTIDASKGIYMAIFPLDTSNTPAASTYNAMRLTYMYDAAPSAQMDFYLLGWYAGGLFPGGTLFQVTTYASTRYGESEAVTCRDTGGVENTQLGMSDKRNKFEVPVTGACSYSYRVSYEVPSLTQSGNDYNLFYAQFPNENGFRPYAFYLVGQQETAALTGAALNTVTLNTSTLLPRQAPKPFHRSVYPFKTAFWADGRLFLGGVKRDASATLFGGFFVSAKGDPFDFSEFERFHPATGELDLTGPCTVPLGGETPQAIASLAATRSELEVTTPLLIVTDKATWGVNTKDTSTILRPIVLAPYGTKAADSVCVGNGAIFFFDTYRQLRRVYQRVDSPGQWIVDNLWNGIPTTTARTTTNRQTNPRVERVACCYFKDKLYVFYTPTGQSYNVACSVYDSVHDLWYDDTLASGNIEKPFVWPVAGNEPQLRGFSVGDDTPVTGPPQFDSAPKLYQHEKSGQATDDGTAIVTNVQTGMISHPDSDEPMTEWALIEVGIVADEVTSGSFTVTRTVLPSGDSISNTSIDLDDDNSGAYIVRWDHDTDGNRGQLAAGFGHQFSLSSSTFTPGKRIMAIYFKWDRRGGGTDVNG